MEYLKIKRSKKQIRADGTPYATPLFVTKSAKYGKVVSEQNISIKKPILVTGAHDSGKTRWIRRLYEESHAIWGSKFKAEALYLDTISPLAAWVDSVAIADWWDKLQHEESITTPDKTHKPWNKLAQHEKVEALPLYCKETGAVLFIDDLHKLSGRKLQVARQCVMACSIFVVSASEEQRIPPNLRNVVMKRNPQIFRLDSDVSYDATKILLWLVALTCLVAGMWEISAVLAGLQALSAGRRATRSD